MKLGSNDNISLGLSLIITCLVINPIILIYGLILEVPFSSLSIIISLISIAFYIPSSILYLIGVNVNKSRIIIIGFCLGLSSWILSLFVIGLTFESIDKAFLVTIIRISWCPLEGQISFTVLGGFEGGLVGFIPPIWVRVIIFINIASAILCIILGFIIFLRRKDL